LELDEKSRFLDILQRYQSFFKSCKQTVLIVKQNGKWHLFCGKIELSNYDKPLSDKEIFALNDRLLVLEKVERFDIVILTNIIRAINVGTLSAMNKHY
jgi:hypothetical protein